MTVILDPYVIPEQGEFELSVQRKINLQVTAAAAQRLVQRWLLHEVSYTMGAEAPQLVVGGESVFWRVPVILTASPAGRVGVAGEVDVHVESGEIDRAEDCKGEILRRAGALAGGLPPYQPRSAMPDDYEAVMFPPARQPGRPEGDPNNLLPATARSVAL